MKTLTDAKVLLETLEAITSEFLMAKFVEVADVEGFEFRVPLYSKYYEFKRAEEGVPFKKLINHLRVRLYSDEGCVAVYGLKDEPFIYLVEIELRGRRGKRVNLEMVRLHYYVGEEEPDREPLGYIRVGSDSIIGLMADKQACELIDVLARFKNWRVCL
ncbi:MAG: hypothetical protein ACO2PP_23360 [Thermocrinis sp.]|jgi:hypothetical protein|uniref:hypothetical protein n=1 Tax=Thermocrinis sp. TaxID=2024383 RepID=UPI003C0212D5